jgi:hypothetical protein
MTTNERGLPPPSTAPEIHEESMVHTKLNQMKIDRKRAHELGQPALARLYRVACGDSGQCRYIARFLLGLYNGTRFPFDLSNFRAIDRELFDDCMLVMNMDASAMQSVHEYIEDGGRKFEELAVDWNVLDVYKLREAAKAAGVEVEGI